MENSKPAPSSISRIMRSHGSLSLKCFKVMDCFWGPLLAYILPAQRAAVPLQKPIRKILVIRPGGIGDAVFLLPILKVLNNEGILVDVLCEKRNAEIFTSQGSLCHQVFDYTKVGDLASVLSTPYDIVIDTEQWHYLSAILAYFTKTEYRIGFATRALRGKLFNQQIAFGENDYELDNFLRLFKNLLPALPSIKGINDCFEIPEVIKGWSREKIPENSVTVFLGASIPLRRFSKEQLSILIRDLLSNDYCPVILGGRDVLGISRQFLKEFDTQKIYNFTGQTSLMQSAALIQRSQRFIGPDSGLMHVACAVGTPVVAIFGPGNLAKWGPKGHQHQVITENLPCSPCTRFGYTIPTCHGRYQCMKNIKLKDLKI